MLQATGISVEVTRSPYGYTVSDNTGKKVLSTAGNGKGDGYGAVGWTTGRTDWMSIATAGYYEFDTYFDKWRDGHEVTAVHLTTADRLEVVLSDGTHVVHQLRNSTLRVEASRDGDAPRAWSAAFAAPADEGYLGLGERYDHTNQRGHSLYNWPEEGGLSQGEKAPASPTNPYPNGEGMTYYPVPFLISTEGYGFWLDTTWRSQFDLTSDDGTTPATPIDRSDRWRAWHIGPSLAYEVYVPIPGDARTWPIQIIDLFTAVTGRPMLPPSWSFGPRRRIGSDSVVNGESEIQLMRDQKLAISQVDDNQHFLPDENVPPDAALTPWIQQLQQLGYQPICYFNPYFSSDPMDAIAPDVTTALANNWFLRNADGTPSLVWLISGHSVNVYTADVTSADANKFFTDHFTHALDLGYRGWMYDFGEYVQPGVLATNGMTGEELHDKFPPLYDQAAHDALEAGPYAGQWFFFARSGYTGSQQFTPMVWSGDPDASFSDAEGLPAQVRAGINLSLAGVAHWGSDIGGFKCIADGSEAANGELLARWIEFGAMCSNMHDENACSGGSGPKATLWTSDDARAAWNIYAKLHTRMFPYFDALSQLAHANGTPLIRHLFLQEPDPRFASVDDAFMFGPTLLVAPVVKRGATTKDVLLPDGNWLYWQPDSPATAQVVSGQQTLDAPLGRLPLLFADGQLLPLLDPSIDTLVDGTHPGVIGPADVAGVYDVIGFVGAQKGAGDFTLADGTTLHAGWSGSFDGSALSAAADESALAGCEGCFFDDDLGNGLHRVRVSATGNLTAGGLTLAASTARRVRWDLYLY
jgi:sulfoquinovosidase